MKTYKFSCTLLTVITTLFSVLFFSCAKEDLVDPAKVKLTTDWTNRTEGIAIPSTYTVAINNQQLTYSATTNTLPQLDAGIYPVSIHNTADKIAIDGTLVTVTTSGNIVNPQPEYFFSSILDIEFENNKEKTVTAVMQQQVQLLNIELTITEGDIDDIESISASLSGVANTMNLKDGSYAGTGLKVEPIFSKSGSKFNASVRLIGLTAETKSLILNIAYVNGSQQTITSDVSEQLANFGTNKPKSFNLTGNVHISSSSIGFDFSISGWNSQGTIDGEAKPE